MGDPIVEATAGAVGTMVTCVLLYPVDIAKLRMQAGKSKAGAVEIIRKIVEDESFAALYKGLPTKAVHVVLNNYLYFYIYEWLKAQRSAAGVKASTLINTICGVIAGIGNLTVTLPLDTLVVRVQADNANSQSVSQHAADLAAEGPSGMWRGMLISSILTLNPALTFAIFDGIKARICKVLKTKHLSAAQAFLIGSLAKVVATVLTYPLIRAKTVVQAQGKQVKPQKPQGKALPPPVINGAGANGRGAANGSHRGGNGNCGGGGSAVSGGTLTRAPPGFAEVLLTIFREEGLEGLYRGCYAQIFTGVCKSGILLTTKEKIAAFALGLLVMLGKKPKA